MGNAPQQSPGAAQRPGAQAGGKGAGMTPAAQPSTSNNQAGANSPGGKGGASPMGPGKGGTSQTQGGYGSPQLGGQGPAGTVQGGGANSPFAQGQQMYAQPFMQSGMGQQGGMQSQGQMSQGQMSQGPYQQPGAFNPQQGYNPQAMQQGMQNYYTPIPQQMPQSPYQAGYTYGGNAPPAHPATGTAMPLAPIMPNQISQAAGLAGLPGGTAAPTHPGNTPVAATGGPRTSWGNQGNHPDYALHN
jgi:hypothetical protein